MRAKHGGFRSNIFVPEMNVTNCEVSVMQFSYETFLRDDNSHYSTIFFWSSRHRCIDISLYSEWSLFLGYSYLKKHCICILFLTLNNICCARCTLRVPCRLDSDREHLIVKWAKRLVSIKIKLMLNRKRCS